MHTVMRVLKMYKKWPGQTHNEFVSRWCVSKANDGLELFSQGMKIGPTGVSIRKRKYLKGFQ